MTIGYNPRIVMNGLVLCLDAANIKSYPQTGTTWFDLSGSNNHATLIGAPAFAANNGGSFVMTGTQYATALNPMSSQTTLTQNWTVSGWFNIDTTTSQYLMNLNASLYPSYSAGNSLLYLNGGVNDYYTYGGNIGGTGWNYVTFRFRNSDGYRTIYKNGVNISTSGPNNTSIPAGNPSTVTMGGNFRGYFSRVEAYTRVLSDSEILQNFNATRGRYGI